MNNAICMLVLCILLPAIQVQAQEIVAYNYILEVQEKATPLASSTSTIIEERERSNSITFKKAGGLIVVPAEVDGVQRDFILDTGAPFLLLNEKPTQLTDQFEAIGVGGKRKIGVREVEHFSWADIEARNVEAYQIDLKHIADLTGIDLGGLIGYQAIENYELYLDYKENKVILFNETSKAKFKEKKIKRYMHFEMYEHFIVVKMRVGGKMLHFVIDTGAEVNLIDIAAIEKIKAKKYDETDRNCRISGTTETVVNGNVYTFPKLKYARKKLYNQSFTATDLSAFSAVGENAIHGFLGYPFLKEYTMSINFKEKILYIWE